MAIEQKDIDRLLLCRAVIDKHRAFNKARIESLATAKSVTEAKAIIETKIGVATTISADSAVKSTVDIKTVLEEERTKYTLEMYEILRQQGFETYQAFVDFNALLNFAAFKEYYPIAGSCDWCGDLKMEERECMKTLGFNCWIDDRPQKPTDIIYLASYDRYLKGETEIVDGILLSLSYCPKGRGFYNDVKNFKTPPFDVFWGM
jgi:hypothetical protein